MNRFAEPLKRLLWGFVLPGRRFKQTQFLPEKKPRTLFEFLRSPRLVRRVGLGLALVLSSGFAALQVNANPSLTGEDSTVDKYLNITTIGDGIGQGGATGNTSYPDISENATWEIWMFPTTDVGGKSYFTKEESFTFGVNEGVYQWALTGGNTWAWRTTGIRAVLNAWTHVAWVKEGTSLKLYLNGELSYQSTSSDNVPATLTQNSYPFRIGNRSQWEYFQGSLDEARVWSIPRTQTDIARYMHERLTGGEAGLKGYWDFNEPDGTTTIYDRSLQKQNLILVGNPSRLDVKRTTYPSSGHTVITFPRTYLPGVRGWTVPSGAADIRALVVAGGGGGGSSGDSAAAGGGGAGGMIEQQVSIAAGATASLIVGQGGSGSDGPGWIPGEKGQDSVFGQVRAIGGGAGAGRLGDGGAGGSGGGAGGRKPNDRIGFGGAGTSLQGNKGGDRTGNNTFGGGSGGGGGAGGAGVNGTDTSAGSGGPGKISELNGITYAAGGAGALGSSNLRGASAAPNTGNGGGGAGGTGGNSTSPVFGGSGGSGIVVVRYSPSVDLAVDLAGNIGSSLTGPSGVIPSGAFTAEAWIYLRSNSGQTILSEGSSSTNVYIATLGGGDFYLRWGTREATTSVRAPVDRWAHVALVRDSNGNPSFFLDGVQVWSSTTTSTDAPASGAGSNPFRIGIQVGDTSSLNGHVDQVKVWGVNLSASEIALSMHSYGANQSNGSAIRANVIPRAHYDFNEPTDSGVEPDRSGNSRNLTYGSGVSSSSYKDELIIQTGTAHTSQSFVKFNRSYLTASGGWTPPTNVTKFKGVVVGGGGGGSSRHGGGGGAGELAQLINVNLGSSPIAVRVGQGGRGTTATASGDPTQLNREGQGSSIGTIAASGGGAGGGGLNGTLGVGGSGGGADGKSLRNTGFNANVQTTRTDVAFFGNRGGDNHNSGFWAGGGGGGSSAAGAKGSSAVGGVGGAGTVSNLTGTSLCLAAGGGGGTETGTTGAGGTCTGVATSAGVGSTSSSVAGTDARANSGSGGGGGGHTGSANAASGSGGSGVVILSYGPELEVTQTPRAARVGANFTDSIIVRVKDGNGNPAHAGKTVTLSAASGTVLTSGGTNVTSGSVTAPTDSSGVATFTGLGFQSEVSSTQILIATADAYVGTAIEVEPRFVASTVNINNSPTQGTFVDGVFYASQSTTANILNTDLQTHMQSFSTTVESSGTITVEANVVSAASGKGLTLKALSDVTVNANLTLSTSNGDIVLWSRSGSAQNTTNQIGEGRISIGNGTSIATNGGALILAGSNDVDAAGLPQGHAFTNASSGNRHAISLGTVDTASGVTLNSAGGLIRINGQTGSSAAQAYAGRTTSTASTTINSGTGRQDWNLISASTGDNAFESWGALTIQSAATADPTTPAINFYVRHNTSSTTYTPIQSQTHRPFHKFIASGGGNLNVSVTSSANVYAIDNAAGFQFLASSGQITVDTGTNGLNLAGPSATDGKQLYFGADGSGSSSSNIKIIGDRLLEVTANGGSGVVVAKTSGTVSIEPSSTSFSSAQTFDPTWAFTGTSGLTIGKTNNTSAVTVSGTNSVAGNLNVIGGNVTVSGNQTTTNSGNLSVLASGDATISSVLQASSGGSIQVKSNGTVTLATSVIQTSGPQGSGTGAISIWSDADGNNAGSIYSSGTLCINTIGSCTTATQTGGGEIVLGGGSLADATGFFPSGGAPSNGSSYGIRLSDANGAEGRTKIWSGGGDISIRSRAVSATLNIHGQYWYGGASINSGQGQIRIENAAGFSGSAKAYGIFIDSNGHSTRITSSKSKGDAIRIVSSLGHTSDSSTPVLFWSGSDSVRTLISATGGGDILIEGTASGTGGDTYSVDVNNTDIVTTTGNITLRGNRGFWFNRVNTGQTWLGSVAAGTSSSGNITLEGGRFESYSSSRLLGIRTTGTLSLIPMTGQNFLSPVTFPSSEIRLVGLSGLEVGSTNNTQNLTTGTANASATSISGNVVYRGGAHTTSYPFTTTNNGNIAFYPSSTFTRSAGNLSASGKLIISGGSSTLSTGTGTISASDVELSASGNVTVAAPTTVSNKISIEALGTATTALNANMTAGKGGILVKSAGRISTEAGTNADTPRLFETASGPITFWTTGTAGGVSLGNWALLRTTGSGTSGEDITIGGGAASTDTSRPAGSATTSSAANAVNLGVDSAEEVVRILAGSGAISIKAETTSTSNYSGIFFPGGVKIIGGTVELYGKTRANANTGTDAAGVYHYRDTTAKTVIEASATYDVRREAISIVGESVAAPYAMMLGNQPTSNVRFDNVTVRTTGNFADIKFSGNSGHTSGRGVWMAGTLMETYTGNVLMESPSNQVVFSRSQNGRQVTYRPTVVGFGGDITVRSLGRDTESTGKFDVQTSGSFSFIPPVGQSFTTDQTFPLAGSSFSVGSLEVGSSTNTQAVTVGAPVTSSGNITYLGSTFTQSTTAGSLGTLTSTGSGSVIKVVADTTTLTQNLTANNGVVGFEPRTTNRPILVKTNATTAEGTNNLVMTPAELETRVSTLTLRLGNRNTTGNVTVSTSFNLTGKVSNLAIRSAGNVSTTSGVTVTVANLGIHAGGTIDWPGTGGTASVVALNGASVAFGQTADYSVAAVDSIDPEFGYGVKFTTTNIDLTKTVDAFMATKFNPPPAVIVKDKFGNTLAANNLSAANFVAAASLTSSPAGSDLTLDGKTATRSVAIHTFSELKVSGGTGEVEITYTVKDGTRFLSYDSETSPTSIVATYLIKAGFPASMQISMSSSAQAGKTGLSPTVTLKDSSGGVLSSGDYAQATITVSISNDTGRIFIEAGGSATASGGVANFAALRIGGLVGSNYTLTFAVDYLDEEENSKTLTAYSPSFALLAGDSTKLGLDISSQTVASRVGLKPITVSVQDSYGNVRATLGESNITLENVSGPVTLTGNKNPTADLTSKTFNNLVLNGTVGSYNLVFEAEGLSSAVHTVELTHGVAHSLQVTAPAAAINDEDFDEDVVAKILDEDQNLVTTGAQSEQNLVASANGAELTGTKTTQASAGIATFDTLRLTGLIGQKTLSVALANQSSFKTDTVIDLEPGAAKKLALTTGAAGFVNRQNFTTQPAVTVQDISGNTVPTSSATITATSQKVGEPNATLTGDTQRSADSGIATFTTLRLDGKVGQYDLTYSSGDLTVVTQRVSLVHGVAYDVLISGPSEAANDQDFGSDVIAVLRDQDQNVVTSGPDSIASVEISNADAETTLSIGSGTLDATAAAGRATFTNLRLTGPVGSKTVTATWATNPSLTADLAVELTHGVATKLVLVTSASEAVSREAFGAQPIVSVRDVSGNPVNSFKGTVSIGVSRYGTSAGFDLIGTTELDLEQTATATFQDVGLFGEVGTYILTYRAIDDDSGLLLTSATQNIALGHGVANQLKLTAPSSVRNAIDVADPILVEVQDQDGNRVLSSNDRVDLKISDATIQGAAFEQAVDGLATFAPIAFVGEEGNKDLTASINNLAISKTQGVEITYGEAFELDLFQEADGATSRTQFDQQPIVHVVDVSGNLVDDYTDEISIGVTRTDTAKPFELTGLGTKSASLGIASFTGLGLNGEIGEYTLTYSSGDLEVTSQTIRLDHGVAHSIEITGPERANNAIELEDPIEVAVYDEDGNAFTTAGQSVSLDIAGVEVSGATSAQVDQGIASFAPLTLTATEGTKRITATLVGSENITDFYDIELEPGNAASLVVIAAPATSVNREAFGVQPIIRALDVSGNRAVSFTGDISISATRIGEGGGAVISGDATRSAIEGEVTFTGLGLSGGVGEYTFTYSSSTSGITPDTHTLELTHGVAKSLEFDAPLGSSNAQLISEVVVSILDQDRNLVTSGTPWVTVESTRDSAILTGTTQVPAQQGVARFADLVLTGEEGPVTLSVRVESPVSLTDEFDIELGYGTATKLFISEEASGAESRKLLTTQPIIKVLDVSGNEVDDFSGQLTVSVSGSGALSGTTSGTFTGSEVVFTDMVLRGTVGSYTLTFQATESGTNRVITQATQSISLAHGDATKVIISSVDEVANAAPLGTVSVAIRDADDNLVTTGTPEVLLEVSGSKTVNLVGDETADAIEGIATFNGLSILGLKEQKVLTAKVASLSDLAGSKNIELTYGAATQLALVSGVEEASNRTAFALDSVIEVRDSSGNPVENFEGSVTVSATTGRGVVTGTLTETVVGSATVVFDNLRLEGEIDSYVLTYTSLDLTSATQSIALAHGDAHSLVLEIVDAARNDQVIPDVLVRILDENNNPVTSGSPLVTLSGTDLTGDLTENAVEGIATFKELKFVGEVAIKVVSASISNPSITSNQVSVTLSHGEATTLELTTQAAGAVNRAGISQVPVITLRDSSGNPVLDSTATVEVTEESLGLAAADISGTTSRTPINGVVSFTGLGLNGQVGQYRLTFSSNDLADLTQTIDLTHGAAVKLSVAASADTARSGINFESQPVIHILDFDGNLVETGGAASFEVSAELVGTYSAPITLSGEAGSLKVQATAGVATFTSLRLTGEADTYTLDYKAEQLQKASQQVELLAGLPVALQIIAGTEPADAIAGEGFSAPIEVEILDAEGNRVLSDSISSITASLVAEDGVTLREVVPSTSVQVVEGLASFSGAAALSYTLAGEHKISFSDGTRTTVSEGFTISHAAASAIAFVSQPTSLRNDIAASSLESRTGSELVVGVLDQYLNRVTTGPTINLNLAVTSGNASDLDPESGITGNTASTTQGTELVSFPELKLRGLEGSYTLTVTATSADQDAGAIESLELLPIELTFGLPSALVITQSADVARSGLAFTPQPILEVRDNSGNLVADSELVVTANVETRDMVGTVSQAASLGVVRFSDVGISGEVATDLVIRYSTEFPAGEQIVATQLIDLVAGEAVSFEILQQPETVKTRSSFDKDISLQLLDASGNPVESDNTSEVTAVLMKEMSVATPSANRTMPSISQTADRGVVTFSGLALPVAPGKNYMLDFELDFGAGQPFSKLSAAFEVLPGDATRMAITRAPNSTGVAGLMKSGDLIPTQPQLTLYDDDNYIALAASGSVSVEVIGTGGSLSEGTSTASISNGVADFSGVRLVGKPKQGNVEAQLYQLRFYHQTSEGVDLEPVESGDLTVTNAVAASLTLIRGADSGRAGENFGVQPVIHIVDRYGNIVETGNDAALNITASARVNGVIVSVLTGQVKQAVKGVAEFVSLALGGSTSKVYDLSFQVVGKSFTAATQTGVTVGYGNPTRLAITKEPISETGSGLTRSGDTLFQTPVVEIRDSYGNVVADDNREISITLVRNPESLGQIDAKDRVLSGKIEAVNGVADFADLALVTRPGQSYKLRFEAELLTSVDSDAISVRHGLPTSLAYNLQPVSTNNQGKLTKTGSPLNGQPVLRLVDFDGNLATEVSGAVQLRTTISDGQGYVITEDINRQDLDLTVFNAGIATFTNLRVVALPTEPQKLSFATVGITAQGFGSSELVSSDSASFVLTFSDPHKLAIFEQPCAGSVLTDVCQVGITGDELGTQPVIEVQDFFGNRVSDFNGSVSVSTSRVGAGLAIGRVEDGLVPPATQIQVDVENGLATFSELSLVATPGDQVVLDFASDGLVGVSANPISVAAAAPESLFVYADPVGARTGSALATQPVIHVLDRFGNLVLSDNQTQVTVQLSASALAGNLFVEGSDSLTVVASEGVASFQGLMFIGTPREPYRLSFTATNGVEVLEPATSEPFRVSNANAKGLIITSEPDHRVNAIKTGDRLAQYVLKLEDFAGNWAEDDNSTVVEVSLVSSYGVARFVDAQDNTIDNAVGSSILRATASAGYVTFDAVRIVGQPGTSYQLVFTANPDSDASQQYSSAPSKQILLTHADPHSLFVTGNPVGAKIGDALASQPSLQVLDRFGNLASTDNQTSVRASIYEGDNKGQLLQNFDAVSSAGIIQFNGLVATGTPGVRYKLSYQSGSLVGAQDQVGFTMTKVSLLELSYPRVKYDPIGLVSAVFKTDSPETPVFTTTSASSICEIADRATGVVAIKGVGTCLVDVEVPGSEFYLTNKLTQIPLVIDKADQDELLITSLDNVDFMQTLTPTAEGGSGEGRLSFLVEGDCRIIGGVLLTGEAGSFCEITARKLFDDNYKIQYSDPMTITVNKVSQTPLRIENQLAVSVGEVTLVTSGGSGDGAVSYQITTAGTAGCSIVGAVLRATSNGSCGVSATKATSKNHLVATSAQRTFTFTRAEQSVFFTSVVPTDPRVGDSFTPTASLSPAPLSSAPRPITFSITEGSPTVCRFDVLDPTKVNFLTAGRCKITATQAGNNQFAQATADLLIVVGAKNQTISFGALADRRFGQPAFMLQATASSGLMVSYQLAQVSGVQACTVTPAGLVTLTRAGDCVITANQAGNTQFLPAPPVTQLLRVVPDVAGAPHVVSISANNQSITASFNPPSYLGGSNTVGYRLEVTDAQSPEDVYVNPGCSNSDTVPIRCSIVGIPNNREYTVRVAAITQAGIGTYSQVSMPIATTRTSQAVSNLIATPSSGELTLAWEAPVAMDGAFRSYQVYVWPIELGPDAIPSTPSEVIEDESQTTVTFSTVSQEPAPVMMMRSMFSLFSAPELTTIVQSNGYFMRVATLTAGAPTRITDNTTSGIQQSLTTPGLVSEIELTDLTDNVLVAWSTAAFDGGYQVLGYQLRVNGELACELETGEQYCSSISDRMFNLGELELGESYQFEVAAVNQLGVGIFALATHEMPPVPSSSSGELEELDPTKPSKPGDNGPSVLDPDSWIPGGTTGGSDTDQGREPNDSGGSDGSDSSASGSTNDEAGFDWLMILLGLLMLGALLRVVIRGMKKKLA